MLTESLQALWSDINFSGPVTTCVLLQLFTTPSSPIQHDHASLSINFVAKHVPTNTWICTPPVIRKEIRQSGLWLSPTSSSSILSSLSLSYLTPARKSRKTLKHLRRHWYSLGKKGHCSSRRKDLGCHQQFQDCRCGWNIFSLEEICCVE